MAKREVINQYVGSAMGFVWTIVQPLVMIIVFWVVFRLGFKAKPLNDAPFAVWLTAGLCCWFFFADILNGSTSVIICNAGLIKKNPFPSHILPVVKILAALVNHCVFIFLLVGLILFQDMPFSLYYIQAVYYLLGLCLFALGLGWLTSALNPFFRDVGQFVALILQVGMWATPILWDLHMLPRNLWPFFIYNPMYYLVRGYRDSFIYFRPFWDYPFQTLLFWAITIGVLLGGAFVFKRLKPHFAEVL
jgi:lipopolysaccharide transport system permease protein/teichoic acid transport system permease protein